MIDAPRAVRAAKRRRVVLPQPGLKTGFRIAFVHGHSRHDMKTEITLPYATRSMLAFAATLLKWVVESTRSLPDPRGGRAAPGLRQKVASAWCGVRMHTRWGTAVAVVASCTCTCTCAAAAKRRGVTSPSRSGCPARTTPPCRGRKTRPACTRQGRWPCRARRVPDRPSRLSVACGPCRACAGSASVRRWLAKLARLACAADANRRALSLHTRSAAFCTVARRLVARRWPQHRAGSTLAADLVQTNTGASA